MNEPFVSIILRSYNEAWALKDTLPALAAQEYRNWELIAIDSGSIDGSVDLIKSFKPRHFVQILPHEYKPSRVMNHGMTLGQSEYGIFLNADATPQGPNWLRPLVTALQEPTTAAVFGKQIPRPNCRAVFQHDYDRCFGQKRETLKWDHFFSMVSSGIRRDVWKKRGFLEQMQYSEDDEYTRWCRRNGYKIAYCEDSVVMHSHNYSPNQAYRRSFGEAWALAAVSSSAGSSVKTRSAVLGWVNDVRKDLKFCLQTKRISELPFAARIRWEQRLARLHGFRAGWAMHGKEQT